MDRSLYSVSEVVERLGVSQTTLYALLRRGDLPRVKVGRRTFVPAPDLEAYLERRGAGPGGESTVRHATTCAYLVFHNRPCDCRTSRGGSD
jgi:excisionase family DNA binding protein